MFAVVTTCSRHDLITTKGSSKREQNNGQDARQQEQAQKAKGFQTEPILLYSGYVCLDTHFTHDEMKHFLARSPTHLRWGTGGVGGGVQVYICQPEGVWCKSTRARVRDGCGATHICWGIGRRGGSAGVTQIIPLSGYRCGRWGGSITPLTLIPLSGAYL